MTSERIVWGNPDGSIAMTAPAIKAKAPAESKDAWLSRVEAKAHVSRPNAVKIEIADVEKDGLLNAPDFKVGDRSSRNAWRVDSLTGKLFVDFQAAKCIAADRFIAEGDELRTFIQKRLRRRAMILGDANTLTLLDKAESRIDSIFAGMPKDFSRMKDAVDVAAYRPNWPNLEN